MDQNERQHDRESEPCHRCCGAVVSIGAYGDWHHCEACELMAAPPGRQRMPARRRWRKSSGVGVSA